MRAASGALRYQATALMGVVERNSYLVKRYGWWELAFFAWTVANTLTIVFIAKGVEASGGTLDVERQTASLLIGAVIWSYLGIVFEILTETVAWERWEGTIEYMFMAPLPRAVHLLGMGAFAVLYGVLRTAALFGVVALFFGLSFSGADFGAALLLLAVASVSFVGVGMVTAVLPLISPEKGAQLGFIAQGLLLVVSGVYYPVDVMPGWMQAIATVSPATYALHGIRATMLDGQGVSAVWGDLWPLVVLGVVAIPAGLAVFRTGERYAKRHGSLKRNG
jgi:ABC-2 type transport system permease protein